MEFWLHQSKKNKNQLYVFLFPKDRRMDKGFLEAWKQKNDLAFCRHRACSGPRYQRERRSSLVAVSPLKETWWPCTLHNAAKIYSFPFFPMFAGSWLTPHTTTRAMCKNCWHRWGGKIGIHWWQRSPEPHGKKKHKVSNPENWSELMDHLYFPSFNKQLCSPPKYGPCSLWLQLTTARSSSHFSCGRY